MESERKREIIDGIGKKGEVIESKRVIHDRIGK